MKNHEEKAVAISFTAVGILQRSEKRFQETIDKLGKIKTADKRIIELRQRLKAALEAIPIFEELENRVIERQKEKAFG